MIHRLQNWTRKSEKCACIKVSTLYRAYLLIILALLSNFILLLNFFPHKALQKLQNTERNC